MNVFKSIIIKSHLYQLLKAEHETLKAKYSNVIDRLTAEKNSTERMARSFGIDIKELQDTKSALQANLREDRKMYRERIKELEAFRDSVLFSDITSIKFTAHIPDAGWKRTEFKLGLGSCGKEVTSLHWKELDDRYELTQTCTDGERKEFTYYKKDVAGRIEIAYKVANNTTH